MARDEREDAGEFYPGGRVVPRQPVRPGGGGDMSHCEFADLEEKEGMTLKEVGSMVNTLVRKLKGGAASLLLSACCLSAFAAAPLSPDMDFGDVDPFAKLKAVVEASGAISGIDTNAVRDIVNEQLATNGIRSVDGSARPMPPYIHALDFCDTYPDAAAAYYRSRGDGKVDGGCSAVRDGGFLCRNFDFPFDERAEFVVKMSAGAGRFASVGVAQVGTNLTESIVTSGKPNRCYKWLPGATVDGINENGVVAEINVVGGDPHEADWPSTGEIHCLGAVRWVLDNATSAGMAASNLVKHLYFPDGFSQNFHWMIADERETWIVENKSCRQVTGRFVMTNFATYLYEGMGIERYYLLMGGANITNAWYTNAYRRETTPPWLSDLAEVIAYTNEIFDAWAAHDKEYFRGQLNGGKPWWQTVHCSVYDLTNRTLRVAVQEQGDWYTFAVPGGTGVSPVQIREIVQPMIADATNDLASSVSSLESLKRDKTDLSFAFHRWVWSSDDAPQDVVDLFNGDNGPQPYYEADGYMWRFPFWGKYCESHYDSTPDPDATHLNLGVLDTETEECYNFDADLVDFTTTLALTKDLPNSAKEIIRDYKFPIDKDKPGFNIKSFSVFIPDVMSSPQEIPFVGDHTWKFAKIKDSLDELYQIEARLEIWPDGTERIRFDFSGHLNLIGVPDMEIRLSCGDPWYDTPSHTFAGGVEVLMGGTVVQTADLVVTAAMSGIASEHYVDEAVAGASGGTDGQAVTNIVEGFTLRQRFVDSPDAPHAGICAFAVSNKVTNWSGVLVYGQDEEHRDIFYGKYVIEGWESKDSRIFITPSWNGTNWVFSVKIQPDYWTPSRTCDAGSFTGMVADLTYTWDGTHHIGLDATKVRFGLASAGEIDDINIHKRDRNDNVISQNAYGPWIITSTDPNANFLVAAANSYGTTPGPVYDKTTGTWSLRIVDHNLAWIYKGTDRDAEDATSLFFDMIFDEQYVAYGGKVLYTNLTLRANREVFGSPGEQYASAASVEKRRLKSDLSVYTGDGEYVFGDFIKVLGFNDVEGVTNREILQACEDAIGQPQLVWNDDLGDFVWDFSDPSRKITLGGVVYAPMDWMPGSEGDNYLYTMYFDPEWNHFFELTFLRYSYLDGAKKIDGDRLAKLSDVMEAGIKTNDVKNIVEDFERYRPFMDMADFPHANIQTWEVWVPGTERNPAVVNWNRDKDHINMYFGSAFLSGQKIPIEMSATWEGTNWVFRPVGHLPASMGGDLVLPPFVGSYVEYDLPSPIVKLHIRAYEYSGLATVAEVRNAEYTPSAADPAFTNAVRTVMEIHDAPQNLKYTLTAEDGRFYFTPTGAIDPED